MTRLIGDGAYVVGVSGGIDSIVLLDMLSTPDLQTPNARLIVAHFDHGIRDDSYVDTEFVRHLAHRYGHDFETERVELGEGASEEVARQKRYDFLRRLAARYQAKIVTAHHMDDVAETVAINIHRGTGWRGVAVLDSPDIVRPLLGMRKRDLVQYAIDHQLTWHEDSTNQGSVYLRNRLRRRLPQTDLQSRLAELRLNQLILKRQIDAEAGRLIGRPPYSRYFFTHVPPHEAIELLRMLFIREMGVSPTRPQRERLLLQIKVAPAGSRYDVGDGVVVTFMKSKFIVECPGKVLK